MRVSCCLLAFASTASAYTLRMAMPRQEVLRPFQEGRALKVISGLTNFDASLVAKVSRAAAAGGATHLDIACDPELVRVAKRAAGPAFPVMVSAIDPKLFGAAIEAGADMLELGNFDSFYERGMRFSSLDILDMTQTTLALYPGMPLSVTIPHTLASMDEQAGLAQALEQLGVDVIQTEGSPSVKTNSVGVQGLIERASPALTAAHCLSRATAYTPVLASSGMTEVTAPLALAAGAKGVGVGAAVNRLSSEAEMLATVRAIAKAMGSVVDKRRQQQPVMAGAAKARRAFI